MNRKILKNQECLTTSYKTLHCKVEYCRLNLKSNIRDVLPSIDSCRRSCRAWRWRACPRSPYCNLQRGSWHVSDLQFPLHDACREHDIDKSRVTREAAADDDSGRTLPGWLAVTVVIVMDYRLLLCLVEAVRYSSRTQLKTLLVFFLPNSYPGATPVIVFPFSILHWNILLHHN